MASLENSKSPVVLVVDDDEAIRASLVALLGTLGYRVFQAGNVAAALVICETNPPDLVLTDVYMVGADGYELIAAIRAKRRTLPIIAMSGGSAGYDTLAFAKKLGADMVIEKPFRSAELVETIDRCLRGQVSGP